MTPFFKVLVSFFLAGAGQKMQRKLGDPKYDPVTGTHDKMVL